MSRIVDDDDIRSRLDAADAVRRMGEAIDLITLVREARHRLAASL